MTDRVPLYPGRVQLTPVAGKTNIYDMIRSDEPVTVGTALNKANLLTDATETAIWGSTANRTVNDALAFIGDRMMQPIPGQYRGGVRVIVQDNSGNRLAGYNVDGTGVTGHTTTNSRGELFFYTMSASLTLSVSANYIDITAPSAQVVNIPLGGWASVTFVMQRAAIGSVITFLASTSLEPSPQLKTIDLFLLAGGGGSGGITASGTLQSGTYAGGSGGGGRGFNVLNLAVPQGVQTLTIGAGGVAGAAMSNGGTGGATSAFGYSALGGAGGGYTTATAMGSMAGAGGLGGSGGAAGATRGGIAGAGGSQGASGASTTGTYPASGGSGSGDANSLRPFGEGSTYYGGGGGNPGGSTGGGNLGAVGAAGTGGGAGGAIVVNPTGTVNLPGMAGGSGLIMIRIKAYN